MQKTISPSEFFRKTHRQKFISRHIYRDRNIVYMDGHVQGKKDTALKTQVTLNAHGAIQKAGLKNCLFDGL